MTTNEESVDRFLPQETTIHRSDEQRIPENINRRSASQLWLEEYAELGWHLFPCHSIKDGRCSCGNSVCSAAGKHPRTAHGVKDATDDISQWNLWDSQWPDANWGLACGRVSNVIVIDIDRDKHGFDSFDDFVMDSRDDSFPVTLRARSGGGGEHIFLQYPDGKTLKNRANWLRGVDVRSDRGYVILTPGNHKSGGSYGWQNWRTSIAAAPKSLVKSLTAMKNYRATSKTGVRRESNKLPSDDWFLLNGFGKPGEREINAHAFACSLWRRRWNDTDAVHAIYWEVFRMTEQGEHAFPETEARAKLDNARQFMREAINDDLATSLVLFGGVR